MGRLPKYDVLDFFYDNENGCALTARVHGEWFHVMVDAARLQDRSKGGKRISREYQRLLGQVKEKELGSDGIKSTAPLFVQPDEDEEDGSDATKDSGVDVQSNDEDDDEDHSTEPSKALERWMLKPLAKYFKDAQSSKEQSVEDWYLCPTHYFHLYVQDGKLHGEEDNDPAATVKERIRSLLPSMPLHQYISDLGVPIHKGQNLVVTHESSEPADTPLHPCLVRNRDDGKEYFLKTVDRGRLQPMNKRELQVMKRIESEGLHHEMRVPLLRGLVQFSKSTNTSQKEDLMGFLLDPIQKPVPLTNMLDSDVPEEKRLKWAEESARMVDLLHQHGIIWGDAKGDNFMVDKNDDLWIIDFGGSYTEGWVDEELKETEEGDEQGIERLKNGLKDPENNTVGDDDEDAAEAGGDDEAEAGASEGELQGNTKASQRSRSRSRKNNSRKRQASEDASSPRDRKASKGDDAADGEPLFCYCQQPASGNMLGCDGEKCLKSWFHFECVGINSAPSGKWYCKECQK